MRRITFTPEDRDAYLKFQQAVHDIACTARERLGTKEPILISTRFNAVSTEDLAEFLDVDVSQLAPEPERLGPIFQTGICTRWTNGEMTGCELMFEILSADAYPTPTDLAAALCKAISTAKVFTYENRSSSLSHTLFNSDSDSQWLERVRKRKSIRHALIEEFDKLREMHL